MSDFLMAYYDKDRDAVVIQLQSGAEVSVMDLDEASGFAEEVSAAARKESTGYEEYLGQHLDEDDRDEDQPDTGVPDEATSEKKGLDGDAGSVGTDGVSDGVSEEVCPACGQARPCAVAAGTFLTGTICPGCGHVAAPVQIEQGAYLIALDDNGDITIADEHGNSIDMFRLDGALPYEAKDWDHYAAALHVTRSRVRAAVEASVALSEQGGTGFFSDSPVGRFDQPNPGYGSDEPDERTLMDADDALRALDMDIVSGDDATSDGGHDAAPGTCILTGKPGENDEDCTTHEHE